MKLKLTKVERDALRWVNKIRRAEGRKALARLPKGDVGEAFSCPLARALNHGKVGVTDSIIHVGPRAVKKIAALKKAGLHRVPFEVDQWDEELTDPNRVAFQLPRPCAVFVSWFDEQIVDEAIALARDDS